MTCENLDGQCAASWCDCDRFRRITDTGLRTLARERGMVVLTGEQAAVIWKAIQIGRAWCGPDKDRAGRDKIDAAICELEGAR